MAKYARGRAHWPLQESIEYEEIPHIASLIRVPSRREESCPTNPFVRSFLRQEALGLLSLAGRGLLRQERQDAIHDARAVAHDLYHVDDQAVHVPV